MLKKYILLLTIMWLAFQPFENVNAALRTKAKICAVKGTVQTGNIVRDGGEMTCPLKRTMNQTECRVVNQETMIETGPDGWATIEYADGKKVKIMPNTKVVLRRNAFYIQSGSSWFKVERNSSGEFVVNTPTAIAGIRGTEFIVNVDKDGSTNFQLIEGSVEISDAKKKSSMMLAAGMEVSIAKGSSTLNTALLDIKENNKWWTDWPTLIPISEMPGFKDEPTTSTNTGNTFFPIADNHVYAYSYSNWNKSNWGKYEQIGAGWNPTGGEKRAYLKFDLSGINLDNFKKATLKLYHNHTGGGNAVELGVYAVEGPWTEGRGTYKPPSAALPSELTWNNQPKIARYPTVYFNPGQGTNKWVEVDVTTLVKAWLEGFPNHGMVIKAGENYIGKSEAQYGFYSREYKDADKRPQLILNGTGIVQQPITNSNNLLLNGSFENPPAGWYKSFNPGQDISGWRVINAAVDLTGTYFKSSEGKQSMDLHGSPGFGGIEQTITTRRNQKYRVVFDFSGNPAGIPKLKRMRVSAAGQSKVFEFDCTGKTTTQMGWTTQSWNFTANSSSTTIRFETLSSSGMGNYGPAIDNVKVFSVEGQSNVNTSISNIPKIDGEWEMTCIGDIIFKFKLTLVQHDDVFYGDMVRTNGNEALAKIEGQILADDRIEFTRSIGNWKQYYTGEINQKSGSRATSFEGMFGFKDQLNREWYAKAINGSNQSSAQQNIISRPWVIGTYNGIHYGTGSGWKQQTGGGKGKDIAIDGNGRPWVIGTDNGIYYHNGNRWVQYPGGGKGYAIAVSWDGTPWVIGTNNHVFHGTGSDWVEQSGGGIGKDIAIDGSGRPWVIGSDNSIWYHNGIKWIPYPGSGRGLAISVTSNGTPWVIGMDNHVYYSTGSAWIEQSGGGIGKDIAIDGNGRPWVIGQYNGIHYHDGNRWIQYPGGGRGLAIAISAKNASMITSSVNKQNTANFFSLSGRWLIDQHNGYNGTLNLQQTQASRFTGTATWDRYESGTIDGQISGNSIEFTISYSNGVKGFYKGTLTQDGTMITNGTVKANNGVTATWDASR